MMLFPVGTCTVFFVCGGFQIRTTAVLKDGVAEDVGCRDAWCRKQLHCKYLLVAPTNYIHTNLSVHRCRRH